ILPQHPLVTGLMTAMLIAAATMGLGGIVLYGILWRRNAFARRQRPAQRWHRSLGIGVSLFACLFAFSGGWHLLHTPTPARIEQTSLPVWNAAALAATSATDIWSQQANAVIVGCGDAVCRLPAPRVGPMQEHQHHAGAATSAAFTLQPVQGFSEKSALLNTSAEQAARQALGLANETPLASIEAITEFSGEYGFLNKRLPVLKIAFASDDHATAYWEPSTGAIASVVRDADRYEGYSFGFLHKYHWLDFAGKNVRDGVMALAALLVAVVTCLGVAMGWRRGLR
ncbi:MAG TPA: hypothetical protein VM553_08435, partial [Dongiaceae bacterium]|nr:hypothetical protein [Dongiaceae bacterium]